MRVVWSPLAIERAAEAVAYIAKDSPAGARRWVENLFAVVATLAQLPERGRRLPDVPRADVRELLVGSYRVVYRIEARRVAVLTVRHLRRRELGFAMPSPGRAEVHRRRARAPRGASRDVRSRSVLS